MSDLLIVGCGYLGRRIARLASEADPSSSVFGTTRSEAGADRLRAEGIAPVVVDVLDGATLARLPACPRVVFCVGFDRSAGHSMREVHVGGLARLLDHLEGRAWTGRLVYTSSTGVYGQDDGGWVDEDSPAEPTGDSGAACLEAERLLRDRGEGRDWSASAVRLAGLYGPGRIIQRLALERGEPIQGDPDRWLNLIHADDAARAVLALLDRAPPESLYVAADDRPVRRREYYETLASLISARPPEFREATPGSGRSARDASNKRVRNARLKRDILPRLAWPDIAVGLPASLD